MNNIRGAYVEITGKCNARCPYCYNEKLMIKGQELPFEIVCSLSEQLRSLGLASFTLSGGEPFLHNRIGDILHDAATRGINTTIISNGTCFLPNNQALLLRYSPSLQLTFDGFDSKSHDTTRGSGNFDRVINGYRQIKKKGYHGLLSIRINVHKGNVHNLWKILAMIDRVFEVNESHTSVGSISLSFLHKADAEDVRFEKYILPEEYGNQFEIRDCVEKWNNGHQLQIRDITSEPDIGCPFNGKEEGVDCGVRIAIDGDVFPCQLFSDAKFCIGNIYNNSLSEIINGQEMEDFLQLIRNRRNSILACMKCAFGGVCGSGCPGQAYVIHGDINTITDRCHERKAKLSKTLHNVYYNAIKTSDQPNSKEVR